VGQSRLYAKLTSHCNLVVANLSTTLALFLPLLVQLAYGDDINVVWHQKKVFYDELLLFFTKLFCRVRLTLDMGQTQCQRCNLQVAILKKEPSSPFDATWDIAPAALNQVIFVPCSRTRQTVITMRYRDTVVTTFVQWLVLMPDKGDIERMSHRIGKVTAEQGSVLSRGIGSNPILKVGLGTGPCATNYASRHNFFLSPCLKTGLSSRMSVLILAPCFPAHLLPCFLFT